MLKKINSLGVFIEDCYREISVREYSRLMKMTAPTASKKLKGFESDGILKMRFDRGYLLFKADRESDVLKDISRIYWRQKLKKLFNYINDEFHSPTIILFGSLSKLEARSDSDIDIAVLSSVKKEVSLQKFEKLYSRKIEFFKFVSLDKVNKELRNNITKGYLIQGDIK